jgi:hypothetical protein
MLDARTKIMADNKKKSNEGSFLLRRALKLKGSLCT